MAPQNHPPKPQATHPQDGAAPGRTPSIKGPGQSPVALGGMRPVSGGCDLPPLWQEFPGHPHRQTGSHPGSGPRGLPLAGNERPEARTHPAPGAPQVSQVLPPVHVVSGSHPGPVCKAHLAPGTQRTYMQEMRLPRLLLVRKTSMVSSSRWLYWKSARSIRWSFQRPGLPAEARRVPEGAAPAPPGPGSGSGTSE